MVMMIIFFIFCFIISIIFILLGKQEQTDVEHDVHIYNTELSKQLRCLEKQQKKINNVEQKILACKKKLGRT